MAADARTKRKIEALLRKKFCDNSMVDVSDGYQDHIHIGVVSRPFKRLISARKLLTSGKRSNRVAGKRIGKHIWKVSKPNILKIFKIFNSINKRRYDSS